MAAYAGKTKLPRGNIMDILEGGNYMGPTRYAPAAGGISIGGGLGLLYNKLFNKKKEDVTSRSQREYYQTEAEQKNLRNIMKNDTSYKKKELSILLKELQNDLQQNKKQ